jgi:hypothetical protein
MGEYSKALSFYEQLVQAKEQILAKDHPSLTIVYTNISQIYDSNGESSKSSSSSFEPIIIVKPNLFNEKPLRLTNFRKKLEKIRNKM